MKNLFSKLIPVAAAIGLSFAAVSAQAVTLTNGGSTTYATNVKSLDWNAGAGVASGIGPFLSPLATGDSFEFRYQANLSTVNTYAGGTLTSAFTSGIDTTPNGPTPGKFEFTIVAKLNEIVTSTSGAGATFGLDTTKSNKVAIYYGDANANIADGTGFDDGALVALLTIVPDFSSSYFTVTGPNQGDGFTHLVARIQETGVDGFNSAFLKGLSDVLVAIDFKSTLAYPLPDPKSTDFFAGPGDNTIFPTYHVDNTSTGPKTSDILFEVDGLSMLVTEPAKVPEPGSMMLMGMGMLGLVGAARRRKASK